MRAPSHELCASVSFSQLPPLCAVDFTTQPHLLSAELLLTSSSGADAGDGGSANAGGRGLSEDDASLPPELSPPDVSPDQSPRLPPERPNFMQPQMVDSPHPALLTSEQLYKECEVKHTRGSGPGGQHRNKVATAVVLKHKPTQVSSSASEARSQQRNLEEAVRNHPASLIIAQLGPNLQPHLHPAYQVVSDISPPSHIIPFSSAALPVATPACACIAHCTCLCHFATVADAMQEGKAGGEQSAC